MSTPIYQLFIGLHNVASNLAFKAMPEAERNALMQQDEASRVACGAKEVVACHSAWADEQHPWWGVLRFPSLEARIEHTHTLQKIGWLDAVEAFTLLGTSDTEPEEVTIPNPIYKLWIIKQPISANTAAGQTRNLGKTRRCLRRSRW
jgi:hypothetical protein